MLQKLEMIKKDFIGECPNMVDLVELLIDNIDSLKYTNFLKSVYYLNVYDDNKKIIFSVEPKYGPASNEDAYDVCHIPSNRHKSTTKESVLQLLTK